MKRNETRSFKVGDLILGGNNHVIIQSMCNTKTKNIEATVKQILELENAGCELIRVAVFDQEDALAIKEIKKYIHIPIVADIHFDYRLALTSIESGVDKIRFNPGNIGSLERVKAVVDGKTYYCGNGQLMDMCGAKWHDCHLTGTIIHVARETEGDVEYLGHIIINDQIKEDSEAAIKELKNVGVKRLVMLTGDKKSVAENVANKLGLTGFFAELLPADKVSKVEELLSTEKGRLAFVGDGINDAPVLMRADCGIAMGAMGSDAAIESADVVLMDDKPSKIADAMKIARKTMRIVWENIIFALGVKAVILILGAFGIANMWIAVFGDVGVLIIAILNAMRCMKKISK